jgi:hypothetical protein
MWEGPLGAGIYTVSYPAIGPTVQSLPPMGLCDSDLDILGKAPTALLATNGRVGSTPNGHGERDLATLSCHFCLSITISLSLSLSLSALSGDFGSPSLTTFLPNPA